MKKRENELLRMQSLIENDRLNVNENFEELIISDLNKILKDYFDFNGNPVIIISKIGNMFKVEVSVLANRIKTFGTVPKS